MRRVYKIGRILGKKLCEMFHKFETVNNSNKPRPCPSRYPPGKLEVQSGQQGEGEGGKPPLFSLNSQPENRSLAARERKERKEGPANPEGGMADGFFPGAIIRPLFSLRSLRSFAAIQPRSSG